MCVDNANASQDDYTQQCCAIHPNKHSTINLPEYNTILCDTQKP